MGEPADTRPISGRASWASSCTTRPRPAVALDTPASGDEKRVPRAALMERTVSLCRRIPREVPLTSSITPLRASALRWSSAELADLKPSLLAISARVGGAPVREMAVWIRSRISCWRAVSLGWSRIRSPCDLWCRVAAKLPCTPTPVYQSSTCIFNQFFAGGKLCSQKF